MNDLNNDYLYIDGVEVTFDTDSDGISGLGNDEMKRELYHKLREALMQKKGYALSRIQAAVADYPDVPIFKNLLIQAYTQAENPQKMQEWIDITVEEHPEYFFGVVQKCIHEMEVGGEIALIEKYFGEGGIAVQYFAPQRKRFHATEMQTFYRMAAMYYSLNGKPNKVVDSFKALHELGFIKKAAENLKIQLPGLVMRRNLTRMQVMQDKNKGKTQNGSFKAAHKQRTDAPPFQHPELEQLYELGIAVPKAVLGEILALPRESLIADLRLMLQDTIYRHHFLGGKEDLSLDFLDIVLAILAELKAEEALSDVLEVMAQDENFSTLWVGYDMGHVIGPALHTLAQHQWDILLAFMKREEVFTFNKATVSQVIAEMTRLDPTRKAEAVAWYSEILQYYLDNAENPLLIDRIVLASLAGDAIDIGAKELIPLFKQVFERDLADEMILGDFKDMLEDFDDKTHSSTQIQVFEDIYQRIDFLSGEFEFPEDEEEEDDENRFNPFEEMRLKSREDEYLSFWGNEPKKAIESLSPAKGEPVRRIKIDRNEKVTVKYNDGTIVKEVKYKKVEDDVNKGKCEIV